MEHFNYGEPADVFVGGGRLHKRIAMTYRRFDTGAEAILFAIERQGSDKLAATVVETGDERLGTSEIRTLYESADFPLPRHRNPGATAH